MSKTIEWPMRYETLDGGSRTLLTKIVDMPTRLACDEAARLALSARGYDPARVKPFYEVVNGAVYVKRPSFTHEELAALWESLIRAAPVDATVPDALISAIGKLNEYLKRAEAVAGGADGR